MRRPALIASILILAAACDKPKEEPVDFGVPLTDISGSPTFLFSVFGPKSDPRAIPIAMLDSAGNPTPLVLDDAGWQQLDSMAFTAGNRLSIFHQAHDIGTATVARGMWPAEEDPLYTLPGCRTAIPQGVVALETSARLENSVELIGASVALPQPAAGKIPPDDPETPGRTLADAVASGANIAPEELGALQFSARWLQTGAGASGHTLVATYVDPEGGDAGPGAGHSTAVLVIAEDSAGTFKTSFRHTGSGEARTVTAMRVVNYADLDNDGISELLLESWRYGGVPDLVLLKFTDGRWHESFRVSTEWCVQKAGQQRR